MKKVFCILLVLALSLTVFVSASAGDGPWTCTSCGRESEGNFCSWCGAKKPAEKIVCPSCGKEFDPDAGFAFCNNCGASLAASVGSPGPDIHSSPAQSGIAVGSIVTFGRYEQDEDSENGYEPIEWIVLDVQDGRALLLSRYGLDVQPYHEEYQDVSWEYCTLRDWLNYDFMNDAFSYEERQAILQVNVDNGPAQGYSEYNAPGCDSTLDYVFLLSYYEAFSLYLGSDEARMCVPTEFAIDMGVYSTEDYQVDGQFTASWWLRSPGSRGVWAMYVFDDGSRASGDVNDEEHLVRPAMWVSLGSGMF